MHLEAPHLTSPGPSIKQRPHSTNVKNCTFFPLITTEAGIIGARCSGMTITFKTRGKGTESLMSELKMLAELNITGIPTGEYALDALLPCCALLGSWSEKNRLSTSLCQ